MRMHMVNLKKNVHLVLCERVSCCLQLVSKDNMHPRTEALGKVSQCNPSVLKCNPPAFFCMCCWKVLLLLLLLLTCRSDLQPRHTHDILSLAIGNCGLSMK